MTVTLLLGRFVAGALLIQRTRCTMGARIDNRTTATAAELNNYVDYNLTMDHLGEDRIIYNSCR